VLRQNVVESDIPRHTIDAVAEVVIRAHRLAILVNDGLERAEEERVDYHAIGKGLNKLGRGKEMVVAVHVRHPVDDR
jgi:hypothetical protein